MMEKKADSDYPIQALLAARWSPYAFSGEKIPAHDLCALFEAARWAPSAFNEQPWRYIVATREQSEAFEHLLACLNDSNRIWAQHAYALALGISKLNFTRNDKPNKTALHDLGLASANLCVEATARNIYVHQMAGILPDEARKRFQIPDAYVICTGLALGYRNTGEDAAPEQLARDNKPRSRNPLTHFVFSAWDKPADFIP